MFRYAAHRQVRKTFDGCGVMVKKDVLRIHEEQLIMAKHEVGCCGAYCGTCRAFKAPCKGCTVGYSTGGRDINKARCKVKVCCVTRGHMSCADCTEFECCSTLAEFHCKPGYKYGKYRQALDYIRVKGYSAFHAMAGNWTNAYGRYPP